jgi:hypothetical protein
LAPRSQSSRLLPDPVQPHLLFTPRPSPHCNLILSLRRASPFQSSNRCRHRKSPVWHLLRTPASNSSGRAVIAASRGHAGRRRSLLYFHMIGFDNVSDGYVLRYIYCLYVLRLCHTPNVRFAHTPSVWINLPCPARDFFTRPPPPPRQATQTTLTSRCAFHVVTHTCLIHRCQLLDIDTGAGHRGILVIHLRRRWHSARDHLLRPSIVGWSEKKEEEDSSIIARTTSRESREMT